MAERHALWPSLMPPAQQGDDGFCAVSARGVRVRFADGRERLCGTSGLWNVNLGYGNEAIAEAAAQALRDASYLTTWGFENVYARRAAEALIALAGPSAYARVFFSTSGGAVNDAAMKVARQFHALQGRDRRRIILSLNGGFHGLTFGAFALTTARLGQRIYGVDRRLVGHVPANDVGRLLGALEKIGDQVAAIVVEPVIGTGAIVLEPDYVEALIEARSRHGVLIVADEIATAFGRVAPRPFASQAWRTPPDILLAAKAMTNGTQAASAMLVSPAIAAAFDRAGALLGHAETQAGTPVACASILAALAEMERLQLFARGAMLADRLDAALRGAVGRLPLVAGIGGIGCMRVLLLAWPGGASLRPAEIDAVVEAIRVAGALVHPAPGAIQLVPALVTTPPDLADLFAAIAEGLADVAARAAPLSGPIAACCVGGSE